MSTSLFTGGIGVAASLILGTGLLVALLRKLKARHVEPGSLGWLERPDPQESEITSLADNAPQESDPRIHVEIVDARGDLGTRFVLYNRGEGDAYDVQIQAIGLKSGTATFRNVPEIKRGGRKEKLPNLDSAEVFLKHDFADLLMHEWKSYDDATMKELPVRATVTYRDSKRNWFETSFEIVFFPFEEIAPHEWADRPQMVETTRFRWRRLGEFESKRLMAT